MQRVLLTILLIAGLIGGVHWYTHEREVPHAVGVLADAEPRIKSASDMPLWRDAHGFRYRALGRFGGRVIVVSRTNYSIGDSPVSHRPISPSYGDPFRTFAPTRSSSSINAD